MPLRLLAIGVMALIPIVTAAAGQAEKPIYGGLGAEFGRPLAMEAFGAEVAIVPEQSLPVNQNITLPPLRPGNLYPWRLFPPANLPRPYRDLPHRSFIMLNQRVEPLRVITRIEERGCGEHFDWLKSTLAKKYEVDGEVEITAPAPYERALRISYLARQIDVRCGPATVIEYLDGEALTQWAAGEAKLFEAYQRELADIEKRRLVMNQRRAMKFADSFTVGDEYRLEGAFGIQFQKPFARNSTQNFPVDAPFYAVLPNLPEPFDQGDIQLVISPDRHPIVIRGTFTGLVFDDVADAFKAKYGQPMKASSRHIIHRVSSNHAIVKKLAEDAVEIAFIDTVAQSEQRKRLWAQESDGL